MAQFFRSTGEVHGQNPHRSIQRRRHRHHHHDHGAGVESAARRHVQRIAAPRTRLAQLCPQFHLGGNLLEQAPVWILPRQG
jgi:hypothetical protein